MYLFDSDTRVDQNKGIVMMKLTFCSKYVQPDLIHTVSLLL